MFEKLFLLVKNNAKSSVIENPLIPQKYHEPIINDATSTIIEVLKGQMETGKMNDLVSFFQLSGIYNNSLVKTIVNKCANKLNKFYSLDTASALTVANSLIPPVMLELVKQSKNKQNKEFSLGNFLSKLNGNKADLSNLLNRMTVA